MKKFNKGLIASLAVVTAGTVGSIVAVTANQPKVDNVNNDQPSIVEPIDSRPKVEFVTNGGSVIETQHVDNGSTIEEPVSIRGGYKIVGWFLDQACSKPYDFNTPVTEDIKLYALWRTEFTFDIVTSSEGATCTVTGYNGVDTDITIPSEYEGFPVTAIGNWAFGFDYYDSHPGMRGSPANITSVIIPDTIIVIGDSAFQYCGNLISVTIGNCVKSIGDHAFYGCSVLNSIIIPDSVITIGNSTFDMCYQLTSASIGNNVTSIGDYAFMRTSLTSVTIGENVASIGFQAFASCNFDSISIPVSVRNIGSRAFEYCHNLTSIVISDKVTTIGGFVFNGCTNLSKIYCEVKEEDKPDGWNDDWLSNCYVTVIWDCDNIQTQNE